MDGQVARPKLLDPDRYDFIRRSPRMRAEASAELVKSLVSKRRETERQTRRDRTRGGICMCKNQCAGIKKSTLKKATVEARQRGRAVAPSNKPGGLLDS